MGKEWKYYNEAKDIIRILNKYDSIVIYDTETTGVKKKKDRILQFSASRYLLPNWEKAGSMNIYIKCPFCVNGLEACEVNHITDELLEEKGIEEEEAFELIYDFMSKSKIVAGYNNHRFDDTFMDEFYKLFGKNFEFEDNIDVYPFVKKIVPDEAVMHPDKTGKLKPSYKLCYVTEYYDPENEINFHSADSDVDATAFVFRKTIEKAKEMMEEFNKKEEERKAIPRRDAKVKYVNLFNPSQFLRRAYVNTNQGTIYYDDVKHTWNSKNGNIDSLNMDGIIEQVFKMLDITKEDDIIKALKKRDKDKEK